MTDKHIFALHTSVILPAVQTLSIGSHLMISDSDLAHRAFTVLRLGDGEDVIIFDNTLRIQLTISCKKTSKKNTLEGTIQDYACIRSLSPHITLYQGLLKRDAFEAVAYCAGQMGLFSLVPLISEKVQSKWAGGKEYERLHKIMIAGCQQGKQFAVPEITPPISFSQMLTAIDEQDIDVIYFDHSGAQFFDMLQAVSRVQRQKISIVIGPEGGFTQEELGALRQQTGSKGYRLTPTILRSQDAAIVALGALRSVAR